MHFTVLAISVPIKSTPDEAQARSSYSWQWQWRDPTDQRDSKRTPKSYSEVSKKRLWTIVLRKFPSKPIVPCMGGCTIPYPQTSKNCTPALHKSPSDCSPGERMKWLNQASPFWKDILSSTVHLYLKSTWISHRLPIILQPKTSETSKLQQSDLQMFLRYLIIIKNDYKSEPTSVCAAS